VSPLRSATAVQDSLSLTRAAWIALAFCLLVSAAMLYRTTGRRNATLEIAAIAGAQEKLRPRPRMNRSGAKSADSILNFAQRYFRRLG